MRFLPHESSELCDADSGDGGRASAGPLRIQPSARALSPAIQTTMAHQLGHAFALCFMPLVKTAPLVSYHVAPSTGTMRQRPALQPQASAATTEVATVAAAVVEVRQDAIVAPARDLAASLRVPGWLPALVVAAGVGWQTTLLLAAATSPAAQAFKLIYAGAIAGVVSRTCCAPLEMVSTVMMCRGDQSKGMWSELQAAWAARGWAGLFKGNGANCLKVAPSRGTQFLVYELVKRQLIATGVFAATAGAPLNAGARLLAGGIAGMVAALLVYPLETVKTVMTVFPDECGSVPQAVRTVMAKAGGVGGLYRGLAPTLVAMFPYVGVEFMAYETLKRHFEAAFGPAGIVALLAMGAAGGAAAQISAHPLDVVRRRMQMQGLSKGGDTKKVPNLFVGLYTIAKEEGVHVLFKGLGPACLEKAPSTAIGYFLYEAMKATLRVASV